MSRFGDAYDRLEASQKKAVTDFVEKRTTDNEELKHAILEINKHHSGTIKTKDDYVAYAREQIAKNPNVLKIVVDAADRAVNKPSAPVAAR